jgi:hypothetical protein
LAINCEDLVLALAPTKYFLSLITASAAIVSRGSAQPKPVLAPPPNSVVPVNVLSGAQAFIGPDEARFAFPRQASDSYQWDVPIPGVQGGAGYMWDVSWEIPDNREGTDPFTLWLVQWWKSGGPRNGSLTELIEWLKLRPMIKSTTSSLGVTADPRTDYRNVFATVENGQLIFIVRGADAVRRIFPTIPSKVTFKAIITETPQRNYGAGQVRESQTVIVNCRNSDESPAAEHRCDVTQ